MALNWNPDKNPFTFSALAVLGLGANLERRWIRNRQTNQKQMLSGQDPPKVSGIPLDAGAIDNAALVLSEPAGLVAELAMAHPQRRVEKANADADQVRLERLAVLPPLPSAPSPLSALALYWLLPAPEAEAAELPTWEELGIPGPHDPEDLAWDIVFDI
jgi:hypothetical protein